MKTTKYFSFLAIAATLSLFSCKSDEFDGIQNVDPIPEYAITFPDADDGTGHAYIEDLSYIVFQNSIATGSVIVNVKVPDNKSIASVSISGQRYRGALIAPNKVPTAGALRLPAPAFNRASPYNLGTDVTGSGSTFAFTMDVANLPAVLRNATTLNAVAVNDTFRFFFLVKFTDGSSALSTEARVVVKG